jgi:hypothetical protein
MRYRKVACPFCAGHIEYPRMAGGTTVDCPHCSGALSLPTERPSVWPRIASILGTTGLAILGLWSCVYLVDKIPADTSRVSAPDPERDSRHAWLAGREMIRKVLKAPSTAKFSDFYTDGDTGCRGVGTNIWEAWGWVDSENSFSAMLRSKWLVQVELSGGYWRLIYMNFDGETVGRRRQYP